MFAVVNTMVYGLGVIGSILSGILLYDGLLTKEDKRRRILLAKRRIKAFQIQAKEAASPKELDLKLQKAGNPFGLNAFRYQLIRYGFVLSLILYYFIMPFIVYRDLNIGVLISGFFLLLLSSTKRMTHSLFQFTINKLQSIQESRKNNEVFQLHDLLISEFQLMETHQVNAYHVLKGLYKHFEYIQPELQELLQPSNWKDDPTPALEHFANRINTSEAHMLVNILAKFDKHMDRHVAISSLQSNSKLFATKQIENYRVRQKLVNDLAMIPVFVTHMLILGLMIGVVVILCMNAMQQSTL